MHRFHINFRQSASDRAAEISARAYNHYLRFKPYLGKIYAPLKHIHSKIAGQKDSWLEKHNNYGQNKKGTDQSR